MNIYEGVSFILAVLSIFAYLIVISKIYHGWDLLEETYFSSNNQQKSVSFTIIIAARNEALNIGPLLKSIQNLDYNPHDIQVIVVDDHSLDETKSIAELYSNVEIISLTEKFGKKAAMTAGVERAINSYVWFVDADTVVHKDQAKLLQVKINDSNADFIACPIIIQPEENVLSDFQFLDNAAMMAITANGISKQTYYLANGANMVVKKEMFYVVGGFTDNESIASGDDVFLIKKIAKAGGKTTFLKSKRAAVTTRAELSWKKFLLQRKRWASKTKSYASIHLMSIQGFVFYIHVLILIFFVSTCFLPINFFIGLFLLFIKAVIDFLFLARMSSFFDHPKALKAFIPSFFIYFIYIFFTAYHALFPNKYWWKDRENIK